MMNGAAMSGKRKRPILLGVVVALLALTPGAIAQDAPTSCGVSSGNILAALVRPDGVEIPFLMRLWPCAQPFAVLNGDEGTPYDLSMDASMRNFVLNFPEAAAHITLPVDKNNPETLEGEYFRVTDDRDVVNMPVRATIDWNIDPINRCSLWMKRIVRTSSEPLPRGPEESEWQFEFSESGAATGTLRRICYIPALENVAYVAEMEIELASGERRRLHGSWLIRGMPHAPSLFEFSFFDGKDAYLLTGEQDLKGERMTGEFFSGATHRETFTATRLPPGARTDSNPEPAQRIDLSMMNLQQNEPHDGAPERESKPLDPAAFHPPSGWFNVELLREDGAIIPFTLFVPNQALAHDAVPVIRVGGKPVPLSGSISAGGVTVTFPHYDAGLQLSASKEDAGLLSGVYRRTGADGSQLSMPARATRVQRLTPDIMVSLDSAATLPDDAAPVSERAETWRFDFQNGGPARGLFTIARYEPENAPPIHTVRGTIMTPTGDYRFLSGDIDTTADPPRFSLSTFDGAHAFSFEATMDESLAHMRGVFRSGPTYSDTFTASRLADGEDIELPDPFSDVSLKQGESRLHLPQLEDPKYAGKAVIVNIMGTWCPNCHDEAPVLADLHRRYNDKGLEILSLAFEFGLDREDGEARAERQIERFRERHRAQWDIVLAGSSDKQQAARALPALSAVKAYPTTIFLDRDHTVRAIHSGFAGPATGERHEEVKREFERLVGEVLKRK